MTYIDDIKHTESEAKKIIQDAQKEADDMVAGAKREAEEKRTALAEKLTAEATDAAASQKKSLAARYRTITTRGQAAVDEVRSAASLKKNEAVRYILNNFSS